jgi:sugar phosphate isomerase/epimerase
MVSRRSFLQQAGLISAGLLIKPSILCSMPIEQKVGLQLYSLREVIGKDVKGVIAKVAAAGYKEVEPYGYSVQNKFWGMDPKTFKQLLNSNGLTAPSGHYGFDPYFEGKEDDLKINIEAAKQLDQEYLVVPYLGEQLRKSADDYKKIAAKLNKAGEICKSSGIQLAYHNHDFEFIPYGGTTGYDIFLKETDPSLLKFELDLYWAVRAKQNVHDMFTKNSGRYVMWHIKDMDKANPGINTEVGSGSIDFKKIFADAKLSGVKHFFVEQENFSMDPFASIQRSSDYVRKNLFS